METKYFSGILCMVVVDFLSVATGFVVREYKLSAPDIALSKGLCQVLFSLIIIVCGKINWLNQLSEYKEIVEGDDHIEIEKEKQSVMRTLVPQNRNDRTWTLLYGFLCGVRNTTSFAAVLYVPVLDFTVLGSSTVIFTLVFAYIWIDIRFTVMNTFPCLSLLAGIFLALKPSFIFDRNDMGVVNRGTLKTQNSIDSSSSLAENQYWIGVVLSLLFSISGGMVTIIPKKCGEVPFSPLLFWSGIGDVVGACLLCALPTIKLNIFTPSNLSIMEWLLVVCLSIGSVAQNSFYIYGYQIGSLQ